MLVFFSAKTWAGALSSYFAIVRSYCPNIFSLLCKTTKCEIKLKYLINYLIHSLLTNGRMNANIVIGILSDSKSLFCFIIKTVKREVHDPFPDPVLSTRHLFFSLEHLSTSISHAKLRPSPSWIESLTSFFFSSAKGPRSIYVQGSPLKVHLRTLLLFNRTCAKQCLVPKTKLTQYSIN